jgi:hypothetical protein
MIYQIHKKKKLNTKQKLIHSSLLRKIKNLVVNDSTKKVIKLNVKHFKQSSITMNKTALNEKIQQKPSVNKKLFDKKNQQVKKPDTASYNE